MLNNEPVHLFWVHDQQSRRASNTSNLSLRPINGALKAHCPIKWTRSCLVHPHTHSRMVSITAPPPFSSSSSPPRRDIMRGNHRVLQSARGVEGTDPVRAVETCHGQSVSSDTLILKTEAGVAVRGF